MIKITTRKHETRGGIKVKALFEPTLKDYGHLRLMINGHEILTVGNIRPGDYRFNRQLLRVNRDGHPARFTNINFDAIDRLLGRGK